MKYLLFLLLIIPILGFSQKRIKKEQGWFDKTATDTITTQDVNGDLLIDPKGTGDVVIASDLSAEVYVSSTTTIISSSDAVDVSEVSIVFVNTTDGDMVIGGFDGGVTGQIVFIVIIDATNRLTIEHDEGTGEEIFLNNGGDVIFNRVSGGMILLFNGTAWFECGY